MSEPSKPGADQNRQRPSTPSETPVRGSAGRGDGGGQGRRRGDGGGGDGGGGGGGRGTGVGRQRSEEERDEPHEHGRRRQREQPLSLTTLESVRRFSGLFFGLYIVVHMGQQIAAVGGAAVYDRIQNAIWSVLRHPVAEGLFVWAPLAVHLGSDVAFRLAGGRKGGGVRRRFSFWSGYVLLALVAVHVAVMRLNTDSSPPSTFAQLHEKLSERGAALYAVLVLLSAVASVHLAAGTINALHQAPTIDERWRDRLDRVVIAIAALLFAAVCVGLVSLGMG